MDWSPKQDSSSDARQTGGMKKMLPSPPLVSSSSSSTSSSSFSSSLCLVHFVRLLLVLGCLVVSLVDSFNVDQSIALVKRGPGASYFGFSVVPHKIRQKTTNESLRVLLVGAPRDNVTYPSASDVVRRTLRPGSVYSCPLTYDPTDCIQLGIAVEDPKENEDRSDQWMGGTVASQTSDDGTAIVCAHRYKKWGSSFRWGLGWCISLTNDLEEDRFWEPCAGKPTGKGHGEYGFCQAGTSAAISREGEIVLGAPGPFNWRGAIFTNSLHDVFQTWQQSPVEDERPSRGEKSLPPGPASAAAAAAGGGTAGGGLPKKPATAYYSYLGMSVQIGNLLPGAKRTYVAGAPRSSFAGQVLLFEMTSDGIALTVDPSHYLTGEQFGSGFGYSVAVADLNSDGRDDLIVGAPFFHHSSASAAAAAVVGGVAYVYINSEQGIRSQSTPIRLFGRKTKEAECLEWRCHDARFGLALAALGDSDLDGFQDLLVGAPYEGGEGAIYIFRGSASGINVDPSQRISAAQLPSSVRPLHSFGCSVSGGVDLDLNGYPDVIVGAFSSDAVVVLWSRPVVDVVVSVGHLPALIDPRLTLCPFDRLPFNCFQLNVCFAFTRRSHQRQTTTTSASIDYRSLGVDFSLQPDKTNDILSRFFFSSSLASTSASSSSSASFSAASASSAFSSSETFNSSIQLETSEITKCSHVTVYLAQNNKDFLNPVKLVLTYKLSDHQRPHNDATTKESSSSSATTTKTATATTTSSSGDGPKREFRPILDEVLSNANEAANRGIEHSVDFVKNCGDDSKCEANLKVQGVLQMDRDEIGQYILRAGQEPELRVFVRIANRLEDAHETILTVLVPEYLKYRGTNNEGRPYSCSPTDGAIHCAIGNPLLRDQETSFALRLDASNVDYSVDEFEIILLVNTTSVEVDEEDNRDVLKVKVVLETDLFVKGSSDPVEVFYGGEIVGESAVRYLEDIGPTVKHSYEVKNVGKSKVPNVRVQISWPYEVESSYPMGKHLLYVTDPPQVDDETRTWCHVDDGYVNPLQLKNRTSFDSRTRNTSDDTPEVGRHMRRASDHVTGQKPEAMTSRELVNGKPTSTVKLDCDLGTAKCHVIHCTIELIDPGNSVVISVLSRLWKSTFIEDYRKIDQVIVSSKAEMQIELSDNIRQLNPLNATEKASTVALPDIGIQEVRSVPLWIVIASVTAGVLFLCLFIWILWKCGFFRRKRGVSMQHKAIVKKSDYHYNLLQHSSVTIAPRPAL